jgi:carbon storage regulator CsrA
MLVLSRRPNEKIVLPDLGITVQVLAIRGNAVKIGIEAPHEVRVLRSELQGTEADCVASPARRQVREPVPQATVEIGGAL